MKFEPHSYQKYCINRLLTDQALGLFLDMGLGKTVITLTAINDLKYNQFAVRRVLVIAPKKVAESTWGREAAKWDHLDKLRVVTVIGSQAKRIRALNTPADIWVINRENVQWLVDHYRNSWPFDMVVIDEMSSFKNHQAKRFKSLTWVRGHMTRVVGLTGTPAPNGLIDLWAQVFLLDRGERLGKTIGGYRARYFEPDQRSREQVFSYSPKPGADDVIRQKIGDICVSMKAEDYLDLPDYIEVTVPVRLDDKAAAAYADMERRAILDIGDQTIDAGTAAVLTGKLLQLCNGAIYDADKQAHIIHDCKIDAFMELVEGLNGQHALVFYNFQHDLSRILIALKKTDLRIRELKGPQDETDWNNGEVDILLAHPASCAYGLNLQAGGHHLIWFGLNWSLELYQQANKRLHRQGQQYPVIAHHLVVEGGMDADVMTALADKSETQEMLMQALKARIEKVRSA